MDPSAEQDPVGPPSAPQATPTDEESAAESDTSGRQAVTDPNEARPLEGNQPGGGVDEDEDENDENYEPNGDMEDSDSEISGDNQGKGAVYVWRIENFSEMRHSHEEKQYSDKFKSGDYYCRVLLFPRGNPPQNRDHLSIYVEILDIPLQGLNGQFSFKVVDQKDDSRSISKEGNHKFTQQENDRGFARLIHLGELENSERGFLVDDTLEIHTSVRVKRMSEMRIVEGPRTLYDSKKETGFVGLRNQGATCYMNSLLQFMFHIPRLREAVYNMPTEEGKEGTALALQRVFYQLQNNPKSVDTKALTKSFGWNNMDSFMQHDVQEFNRLLCDSLEEKMKGTKVDGMIAELFKGKLENFIECINVDYKSTRDENFYDLSLMVKGCPDLHQSFKQYVEVETLEGDNQYRAEGHGKQDAKKGCRFLSFPPVMHLHLKRFEYDAMQQNMVKINDSFEFPTQIDVSEFLHKETPKVGENIDGDDGEQEVGAGDSRMATEKLKTGLQQADGHPEIGNNLYLLHSVLVHSGSVHGGHYYAYIRPCPRLVTDVEPKLDENGKRQYPDAGKWYRFDDEEVTRVPRRAAVANNFGGNGYPNLQHRRALNYRKGPRASSAYMLVYINYNETLYHPRLADLVKKTAVKINEENRKQQELETKLRQQEEEKDRETQKKNLDKILSKDVEIQHAADRKDERLSEMKDHERRDAQMIDEESEKKRADEQPLEMKRGTLVPAEAKDAKAQVILGPKPGMDVEGEEKELADGKGGFVERPGEKRKRKDVDQDHIRRRKRRVYSALEMADESNEGADVDVPEHLVDRFKKEEEEWKKKEEERKRAHFYHEIDFLCESDLFKVPKLGTEFTIFREWCGLRYPYEGKNEKPVAENNGNTIRDVSGKDRSVKRPVKILKEDTLEQKKDKIAKTFEIPSDRLQYWWYSDRENKTCRPNRILKRSKVMKSRTWDLADERTGYNHQQQPYYDNKFYNRRKPLELFLRARLHDDAPADPDELEAADNATGDGMDDNVDGSVGQNGSGEEHAQKVGKLLLFKYFDIDTQSLRYVGSGVFSETTTFAQLHPKLREMAKLPEDTKLKLYEEENVTGRQINPCGDHQDIHSFKLLSGDIICFQKFIDEENEMRDADAKAEHADFKCPPSRFLDVKQYLTYLGGRVKVTFRAKEDPQNESKAFELELLKSYSPRDIRLHVAKYLKVGPDYVRITPDYTHPPNPYGHEEQERTYLRDDCIMLYEKLSYSIHALEKNFVFEVRWLRPDLKSENLEVLVPQDGKVAHLRDRVVEVAKKKFPEDFSVLLDEKHAAPLERVRLIAIKRGVIRANLPLDEDVARYHPPSGGYHQMPFEYLRAEIIDSSESNLGERDQVIKVFFYHAGAYGPPSTEEAGYVPFHIVVEEKETGADLKARIAEKIKAKRFGVFKLKRVVFNAPQDSLGNMTHEVIEDDKIVAELDWDNAQLGLEFQNKPRNYSSFYDRPMKISAS